MYIRNFLLSKSITSFLQNPINFILDSSRFIKIQGSIINMNEFSSINHYQNIILIKKLLIMMEKLKLKMKIFPQIKFTTSIKILLSMIVYFMIFTLIMVIVAKAQFKLKAMSHFILQIVYLNKLEY